MPAYYSVAAPAVPVLVVGLIILAYATLVEEFPGIVVVARVVVPLALFAIGPHEQFGVLEFVVVTTVPAQKVEEGEEAVEETMTVVVVVVVVGLVGKIGTGMEQVASMLQMVVPTLVVGVEEEEEKEEKLVKRMIAQMIEMIALSFPVAVPSVVVADDHAAKIVVA